MHLVYARFFLILACYIYTAVAPGTAGTANRTTIWTETNDCEMKKGYYLLMSLQ